MFGWFRRKSAGEKILEELGRSAQGIVAAAAESNDTMVGLKGAATVAVIIRESDRCFGIGVEEETIFARFAQAIQAEDLATMTEMTKEMALALDQVRDPFLRGGLVYFWLKGYNLNSGSKSDG